MTFRRRLALVAAAAVAVTIVAASVVVYFVVRDSLRDDVDAGLEDLAGESAVVGRGLPVQLPAPDRLRHHDRERKGVALTLPPPTLGGTPGFGQLVDVGGRVVRAPGQAGGQLPVSEATREVASGSLAAFFQDATVDGSHVRVLTAPAGPGLALVVARSLEETDDTLSRLAVVLVAVSLGGIALAGLMGALVSRAAVAPVRRLTEAAEHVERTRDLGRRIDGAGTGDELARLAASFNAMLAELERAVGAQRQLVADASHELRTPLTSLRTNIEVLARPNGLPDDDRQRLLGDVVAQLSELGTLVGNLVDLARDEEPAAIEEPMRLDLLAGQAVERARRRARDLEFDTRLEPCELTGSPERLERALDNLLDNAVKWSPPDGRVEVTVTGAGEVTVRDHGPGMDEDDVPHVFDRFYRASSARGMPGSGLGLAIVRQVVEAHGGSVDAEPASGGGTTVRMSLPTGSLANS